MRLSDSLGKPRKLNEVAAKRAAQQMLLEEIDDLAERVVIDGHLIAAQMIRDAAKLLKLEMKINRRRS